MRLVFNESSFHKSLSAPLTVIRSLPTQPPSHLRGIFFALAPMLDSSPWLWKFLRPIYSWCCPDFDLSSTVLGRLLFYCSCFGVVPVVGSVGFLRIQPGLLRHRAQGGSLPSLFPTAQAVFFCPPPPVLQGPLTPPVLARPAIPCIVSLLVVTS